MLTMTGQVLNLFTTPTGTGKDGKAYGGEVKVQLQGIVILKNGEKRVQLVTLSTKKPEEFRKFVGKKVQVDVGSFVSGTDIQYYLPENGAISALP